ncbi:MAG: sugar-transfer associated ATP-grasp domain-containing protein [Pseudomonadota bacterium]
MEGIGLLTALREEDATMLSLDKARFAEWCSRCQFPAVETLNHWDRGHELVGRTDRLPDEIVIKPNSGFRGHGIALATRSDQKWHFSGSSYSEAEFTAQLSELSRLGGPIIVQPRLTPHPDLAELTSPAASFLRIVTAMCVSGSAEVISACLDLQPSGQFAVPVDYRVQRLVNLDSGRTYVDADGITPDWSGQVSPDDVAIPDWLEMCALVCQAHEAFPGRPAVLGWDVAATPEGPVLIEVNTGVGFRFQQRASATPVCDGRLGEIIDEWLVAR